MTTQTEKFQAIKGVRDILPPESALWNRVEQTAREVFGLMGTAKSGCRFSSRRNCLRARLAPIRMLFRKRCIRSRIATIRPVSLRPEATASVVRAYIEHGMHTRPGNAKLYYVGPMFRRERPQKGRYRQFYQIGAELLGSSDHPALDAEMIEMLHDVFRARET